MNPSFAAELRPPAPEPPKPAWKIPPARLVLGLLLAITFDVGLQLVWKSAALALPENAAPLALARAALSNPLFLLVIGLMIAQFLNWLSVLGDADLSYAQPITALSYPLVLVLSATLFGETTDPWQWVGVAFVLVGVGFISQTDHLTPRPPQEDAR